jgi:peptidyl-prolyl cis-trans isomerase SurA
MALLRTFIRSTALAALFAAPAVAQQAQPQQRGSSPSAHSIAAVVNDDIITTYDLRQRVVFMLATTGAERTEANLRRIQAQALRNLIDEHLQMQEAERFELTISDQEVNQSVARLIGRNGLDPQEVVQRLASAGISIETMRDQVRSDTAWQRIVNGLFGQRIRISDSVIDETLSQITANASKPSYNVAEIYIEATPDIGGMDGAMEGANAMIAQLAQGAPFPLLAQQFSSAPSAAAGGQIGWVREGELRPEIDSVLKVMSDTEVSKPIQVPGGVYVIALLEKKTSTSDTLYRLRQVTAENDDFETAKARLAEITPTLSTCDSLADDVAGLDDVSQADMGELKASELNEQLVDVLANTEIGALSEPIQRPQGATAIMVCERTSTGSEIPTRDEVENRLMDTQLAQASRKHLRDLRSKATISIRS